MNRDLLKNQDIEHFLDRNVVLVSFDIVKEIATYTIGFNELIIDCKVDSDKLYNNITLKQLILVTEMNWYTVYISDPIKIIRSQAAKPKITIESESLRLEDYLMSLN